MNRQELVANIRRKQSFLCVGLDTDLKKVPEHLLFMRFLYCITDKAKSK